MLVTELSSIDLTLNVELQPASGMEDPASLNTTIEKLFEAQRFVKVQRFDEALKTIEEIKKLTPQMSSAYELEGGIFYLQGKRSKPWILAWQLV